MGKPFKESKIGKLIFSKVGKGLIKSIPFVGDMAANIMDDNNSEAGTLDKKELPVQIVRMAILGVIVFAALKGWISFDDAEAAKGLVTP